jgi:hypothetical protein
MQRTGQTRKRIGELLVQQGVVSELAVAQALGEQWSSPVLPTKGFEAGVSARMLPRLFAEAYGAMPVRVAGGALMYVAFRRLMDPCLTLAMEQIMGYRVEAGVMEDAAFERCHAEMLAARYPRLRLLEAGREFALIKALTRVLEGSKPMEARLARVHDCLWLRMWFTDAKRTIPALPEVEDVICSLGYAVGEKSAA